MIRNIDDATYRRAKAAAAAKGITLGNAFNQALSEWTTSIEDTRFGSEVDKNREFVRSNWSKIKSHKGKAVIVSQGKLQGVFSTYEDALSVASKRHDIALVFVVDRPPAERELDFGAELEV